MSKKIKSRRMGKFCITRRMLEQQPSICKKLFGRCLIWRAEYLGFRDVVEYVAESRLFEPLPEGEIPPDYEIIVENNKIIKAQKYP